MLVRIGSTENFTQIFFLRHNSIFEFARFSGTSAAYVVHNILLARKARNSLIFESRQQLAHFIMERALVQMVEMFYLAPFDLILRPLDPWDTLPSHKASRRVFIY